MGTLYLAVNVLFLISKLHLRTGCLLGWSYAILLLWTLAPHDYVIYCQARGLSGHTSPHGECVFALIWKTPCLLKLKKIISLSHGRTLSGHTWSTTKKFSILNLSSLHPYGKPNLGCTTPNLCSVLGNQIRHFVELHEYSNFA